MAFPALPREPKPGQQIRASDVTLLIRRVKAITPAEGPDIAITGGSDGWIPTLKSKPRPGKGAGGSVAAPPWPFKGYNTTTTTTAQVQINGGDGSLASLNSAVACVNGNRTDTKIGSPAAYPQLAIPGNGYVYAKEFLKADGTIDTSLGAGGTGVDVLFTSSYSDLAPDTATPPTFGIRMIGTVTGYAVVSGVPSFLYNDGVGPVGITTSQVCFNTVTIT